MPGHHLYAASESSLRMGRRLACTVAGTGYTGEEGVECSIPVSVATDSRDAVTGAGIRPAGLGARDTLRLEAGLPLHGHELGPGIIIIKRFYYKYFIYKEILIFKISKLRN